MNRTNICRSTVVLSLLLGLFQGSLASELKQGQENEDESAALVPIRVLEEEEDQGIRDGFDVETAIPWFVYMDDVSRCSGALVHADIIITTATCLSVGVPGKVRVGSLKPGEGGVLVEVQGAIIHPDYTGFLGPADIAVLKLKTPLTNTVALMNEEALVPLSGSDLLFMAGLGLTVPNSMPNALATTLQGMFTYYVEDCFTRADNFPYNPIYHICSQARPSSSCAGDGGSPLVMAGTRVVVALEFASNPVNGNDCDGTADTNFFTRMSSYTPWVKSTTCTLSDNPPASFCAEDDDHKEEDDCFFDFIGDFFDWLF